MSNNRGQARVTETKLRSRCSWICGIEHSILICTQMPSFAPHSCVMPCYDITLCKQVKKKKKKGNSLYRASPWSVNFASHPHKVHSGSTQMRLSLGKVIGWRLQWQGFPLRDECTMGPWGACWRRAFSLQVAPCCNSISGVVGGPQLGLSGGV